MPWAALSDDVLDRMIHAGLDRDARLLYVEGLVYSARLMTDGQIPANLGAVTDLPQAVTVMPEGTAPEHPWAVSNPVQESERLTAVEAALALVATKFWAVTGTGYEVVDFLKANRSADQIDRARERYRLKKARAAAHKEGDHSLCVRSYCKHAPGEIPPGNDGGSNGGNNPETPPDTDVPPGNPPGSIGALSSPLLSSPKERGEEEESTDGRAPASAGAAAPSASEKNEPHPYTDPNRNGGCDICGMPEPNRRHRGES